MIYYFVLVTAILLAVFAQLVIKLRFNTEHGQMPAEPGPLISFIFKLLSDPWLWVAGITLVSAALLWYFVVSRIPLSIAFAFAALSYPLIMIGSQIFLGETVAYQQYIGCALIVSGIFTIAVYL